MKIGDLKHYPRVTFTWEGQELSGKVIDYEVTFTLGLESAVGTYCATVQTHDGVVYHVTPEHNVEVYLQ